MPHIWNDVFDGVYCLNLTNRKDRYENMEKRFAYFDLKVERANALPGSTIQGLWSHIQEAKSPGHQYFENSNYLACAVSHLNIYARALAKGQKRILVLEDDVRINRNSEEMTKTFLSEIPGEWDMLYFAYVPLTKDLTMWSYNCVDENRISPHISKAQDLWNLMGVAVSERMMRHMLDVYAKSFPMEIDRYYVNVVQESEEFKIYAAVPQIIAGEDSYSDNGFQTSHCFAAKSVDRRIVEYHDYI
jgi:GR25 family glycosyltransferase involved in LPS biosynthesis